jgi:hypothetical protein
LAPGLVGPNANPQMRDDRNDDGDTENNLMISAVVMSLPPECR